MEKCTWGICASGGVGCRGCRLVPPSGKLPWTRPGCREARFGSGRFPANRDAVWVRDLSLCSGLFTEQVCFGHRYLQLHFFRARLIKRETLSDKCSFFTIFLRGPFFTDGTTFYSSTWTAPTRSRWRLRRARVSLVRSASSPAALRAQPVVPWLAPTARSTDRALICLVGVQVAEQRR